MLRLAKSKISKTSLSIDKDPPMNASGTDDIKNGVSIFKIDVSSFNIINTIS